jgi:hypothetical protein
MSQQPYAVRALASGLIQVHPMRIAAMTTAAAKFLASLS